MALPTFYDAGTVTVANGATSIVGVGTAWAGKIFAGDLFLDPAQPLVPPQRIAADATDTGIALARAWPGTGLTAHAYEILITPDTARMQEKSRQVLEALGDIVSDNVDDTGQTHLFATAGEKAKIAHLSVTADIDLDDVADDIDDLQSDMTAVQATAAAAAPQATTYSKTEVDSAVAGAASGVARRGTVRAATTANITIATALNNGDVLDGVTLATGNLVLVKNQSALADNGVYVVGVTPARASEFDTYNEHPGSLIIVQEGTVNADTFWYCTSNVGGTLGTTAIAFAAFTVSTPTSGQTLCAFFPFDHEPPATNYALLDIRNGHPVLAFDDTTSWTAIFTGQLPRRYGGGGLTIYVHSMAASATTGTHGWTVAIERIDAGGTDLDADSFATAQTITTANVPGTSGAVMVQSVAFTAGAQMDSLVAGEPFRLKLSRDVASDNGVGNAQVLMVEVKET